MKEPILIDLPVEIATDRLIVRPYRAGDGVSMFKAVEESQQHILPWMPWGPGHKTSEDSERIIRTMIGRWFQREDLAFGIFDKGTGAFLGGTGLHRIDWNVRIFEIGYWIRKSAAGKGYVTEASLALTYLAFEHLDANRVFIRCAAENEKSAAVARRAGFKPEGRLRRSIKDADGNLHDALVFSLIQEEWKALATQLKPPALKF